MIFIWVNSAEAYAYEKNHETEEDPEKTYTRSGIVHTIMVCLEEEVMGII